MQLIGRRTGNAIEETGKMERNWHLARRLISGIGATALMVANAHAQSVLERHPVVVPPATTAPITIDASTYGSDDTKPYGVNLAGVSLLGEHDPVATRPASGLSVAAAPISEGKATIRPALENALRPFLGKPLSAHEIAALQAAVAGVYRSFGLPFVSVTAPPQEITSGVVQLRVIAFHLGQTAVSGAGADQAAIEAGIRAKPGETIDARALSEDLDWLNRTPYRHVGAVFSPGEATALTNLSLGVTEQKPWSLSAGWSNSGSSATGLQRYSLGAGLFLPSLNGTTLSVLVTGGTNFWSDPGRIALDGGDYPDYLSEAARIVIPTFARQQIEITPDIVATRQSLDGNVSVENLTYELPIYYRSALSNILPDHYWGDIYGGVELKGLRRNVYYDGVKAASGMAGLMQFALGWSNTIADPLGQTAIDLRLELNPGSTVADSTDAAWSSYSNGRVTDTTYVYGVANLTRRTDLPKDFSWVAGLTGLLSDTSLPDTEQLALGGSAGSRGYSFSSVAVDRGVIFRNELRLPTQNPPLPGLALGLSPYLFADAAWGENLSTRTSNKLVSLGLGLDAAVGEHLTASVTAGRAMTDADSIAAGDWTVLGTVNVRF